MTPPLPWPACSNAQHSSGAETLPNVQSTSLLLQLVRPSIPPYLLRQTPGRFCSRGAQQTCRPLTPVRPGPRAASPGWFLLPDPTAPCFFPASLVTHRAAPENPHSALVLPLVFPLRKRSVLHVCECWNQGRAAAAQGGKLQAGSGGRAPGRALSSHSCCWKAWQGCSCTGPCSTHTPTAPSAGAPGSAFAFPEPGAALPCSERAAAGDGHILICKYLMFLRKHF